KALVHRNPHRANSFIKSAVGDKNSLLGTSCRQRHKIKEQNGNPNRSKMFCEDNHKFTSSAFPRRTSSRHSTHDTLPHIHHFLYQLLHRLWVEKTHDSIFFPFHAASVRQDIFLGNIDAHRIGSFHFLLVHNVLPRHLTLPRKVPIDKKLRC